jgi:hypothetical protein
VVDPDKTVPVLQKFMTSMAEAEEDNRLAGFVDNCMFDIEENDPGMFALLQHMLAQVKETTTPDEAGHLLFCLAYSIHKARKS